MYNPETRRVVESRYVTIVEPPTYQVASPAEQTVDDYIRCENSVNLAELLPPLDTDRVSPEGLMTRLCEEL